MYTKNNEIKEYKERILILEDIIQRRNNNLNVCTTVGKKENESSLMTDNLKLNIHKIVNEDKDEEDERQHQLYSYSKGLNRESFNNSNQIKYEKVYIYIYHFWKLI